jgi:TRAP-type C4-dicarboxylate transport system permease small subunit
VFKLLDMLIEWFLGALLAFLVCIGGAQVLLRFVLNSPLSWVEELSIVLMVWATMLSGYVGVRRNIHLSADFVGLNMNPNTRWRLDLAGLLLCMLFLCVYGASSIKVIDAMEGIPFASLPFTQPALYWSLPVGALLMALALATRIQTHFGQRPLAN